MLRSMIETALADLPHNRPSAAVAQAEWRAISSLPEHYKDGRFLLFWEKSGPVVVVGWTGTAPASIAPSGAPGS